MILYVYQSLYHVISTLFPISYGWLSHIIMLYHVTSIPLCAFGVLLPGLSARDVGSTGCPAPSEVSTVLVRFLRLPWDGGKSGPRNKSVLRKGRYDVGKISILWKIMEKFNGINILIYIYISHMQPMVLVLKKLQN